MLLTLAAVAGCAEPMNNGVRGEDFMPTPTVDYVANMDPFGGPDKDAFLAQLTMNYRSYALYNARVSGFSDIGEMFAQKAVSSFSGETPMPETPENWLISNSQARFDLQSASRELLEVLGNDAAEEKPRLAAEAQAKYDCWISSLASDQRETADECRKRFENAMLAIKGNGGILEDDGVKETAPDSIPKSGFDEDAGQVDTEEFGILTDTKRTREGVVVVNNINVPADLIRPAPVYPFVFNQNFYNSVEGDGTVGSEMVSRDEFINMMMALRTEIQEINKRFDGVPASGESSVATLKIQQIPTEPKQRIMEEIFEVHFDFNKSAIKPEYEPVIKKLAATARENKNVKVSVIGHTDTVGTDNYNYALGGRRAESVRQMLVAQGIPASSIIVVSSGRNDLKVPTGKNVKNAENRRVRVVKEVRYTEPAKPGPIKPEPVQDQ